MPRVCVVQPSVDAVSETFLQAHDQHLPGVVAVVYLRHGVPWINDGPVLSQGWPARVARGVGRALHRPGSRREAESGFVAAFRRCKAQVVLAEYGTTGVAILDACRRANVALVVHFHGFDASRQDVIERHREGYRRMFQQARAVVSVSRAMERELAGLGCPRETLVYSPYGVDCERFQGAQPNSAEATFLAVGRFVEKKAPHLTLAAFARMKRDSPEARLRMIGDGPLLGVCRDLAQAFDVEDAVTFLGAQTHDVVQREMSRARAFVQHSVVAASGDSEGTPVAVLEAGAMGLPVVATRHAGIPDVVIDGETGLLADERDVAAMAVNMLAIERRPDFAAQLGSKAAAHVRKYYSMDRSLARLARVLNAAANDEDMAAVRTRVEADLPPAQPVGARLGHFEGRVIS